MAGAAVNGARAAVLNALVAAESVPRDVTEPSLIAMCDYPAESSPLALRVIALPGIGPFDVEVSKVAHSISRRGVSLLLSLSLNEAHPAAQTPEDSRAALTQLVRNIVIRATLHGTPLALELAVAHSAASARLDASLVLPEHAPDGASIVVDCVSLSGLPVPVSPSTQPLPAVVRESRGLLAPFKLAGAADGSSQTPAVSVDAVLYAPVTGSAIVPRYDAFGEPLFPAHGVAEYGLGQDTAVAVICEASQTLFLAEARDRLTRLVAVDVKTMRPKWSAGAGELGTTVTHCYGAAVVPSLRAAVFSSYMDDSVLALDADNGTLLCRASVKDAKFAAAHDAGSGVPPALYVSTSCEVQRFSCSRTALRPEGVVKAAGSTRSFRPLAVMPPASASTPGLRSPSKCHLLVATRDDPSVLVISLPDHALVHTHTLPGMRVTGLAADPYGKALVVCDGATKSIYVLPWPLPGMPPLE